MQEKIPETNFETTPDISTQEGRTNLFIDVVTLYHEATKIREEEGFHRTNLTNEELPGFTALHFTYSRLKNLLTELSQKAEQGETITESEKAQAEKLDQRLQTYFEQLQNGTAMDREEVKENDVNEGIETDTSDTESDSSLYETETSQHQSYREELDRLRSLTTPEFLDNLPAYQQYSRDLQKYRWLLETIKDDPEHSVTLMVLQNTKDRLASNHNELKETVESRRHDFEDWAGEEMAEIADALSNFETTKSAPTSKKSGWWNNPDGKTLEEDTETTTTNPKSSHRLILTPDMRADETEKTDNEIETSHGKTLLGLQIPAPGPENSGSAFVFREEVLHTLELARLPKFKGFEGENKSRISKRMSSEQKQELTQVRNIISQISPYSGLSAHQYEQLNALAANTSISEQISGNPYFEKGLLGRTVNRIGQTSKKILAVKLPSWSKKTIETSTKTEPKNKNKIAGAIGVFGGALGAGLVAYHLYQNNPETTPDTSTMETEITASESGPEVTTITPSFEDTEATWSDYPPNLPTQNDTYPKLTNQESPSAPPSLSQPETTPAFTTDTTRPDMDTESTSRPETTDSEPIPQTPEPETFPHYDSTTPNLETPSTTTPAELQNETNIETTPYLPEYVVQEGDNLWNIALGKVEGTRVLPVLANLSETEQQQLLSDLRERLIESEEDRSRIGIKAHPDFIYYSDSSLPVPNGDTLSIQNLNSVLENIKNNNQ